jgi:hypothetical protein
MTSGSPTQIASQTDPRRQLAGTVYQPVPHWVP